MCFDTIDPHQRVVTVEAYITELGRHHGDRLPNTVALYSRPPSAEGEGEQTVSDLIRRATRRLNPTRVIVGEILGDEVGLVLDVFSGSTRGSGCTIHARSARGAVRRFEQYGLAANPPVPIDAINYGLAEAAPIIVHLAGDESRSGRLRRCCSSIVEVTGLDDGRVGDHRAVVAPLRRPARPASCTVTVPRRWARRPYVGRRRHDSDERLARRLNGRPARSALGHDRRLAQICTVLRDSWITSPDWDEIA